MEKSTWKIGELAEQAGLTVRALHHYHNIGLLIPSAKTDAGYRLYTKEDIVRLQQIISLKSLGFALEEIKSILESENYDPVEIISAQLEAVEEQLKRQNELKVQLKIVRQILQLEGGTDAEEFIKLIGAINMANRFLTTEQMEKILEMKDRIPFTAKLSKINGFKGFMKDLEYCCKNQLPASDPKVQELVRFWNDLVGGEQKNEMYGMFQAMDPAKVLAGFDLSQIGAKAQLLEYLQKVVKDSAAQ